MTKTPHISDAEWKVMQVLWDRSPLGSVEVVQILAGVEAWHPNTVRTLLHRLHQKKVLGIKRQKNYYLYRPLISRAEAIESESKFFLDRIFGGAVKPLLLHFSAHPSLTARDLEELAKLLKK